VLAEFVLVLFLTRAQDYDMKALEIFSNREDCEKAMVHYQQSNRDRRPDTLETLVCVAKPVSASPSKGA
jgi:hypothetical protein